MEATEYRGGGSTNPMPQYSAINSDSQQNGNSGSVPDLATLALTVQNFALEVKDLQGRVTSLEDDNKHWKTACSNLETALEEANRSNARKDEEIKKKDGEIKKKDEEIKRKDEKIRELEKQKGFLYVTYHCKRIMDYMYFQFKTPTPGRTNFTGNV